MTGRECSQTSGTTLLVLAKAPVPGRVKTRLTPPYTPQEAARIAEASLADTLDAVLATPARRRVLVLDGEPGPWLPPGIEVIAQCAGGLDERIAAAFAACTGPALLIGMDTPQVSPALLAPALAGSGPGDAWFGPADDGGFWALGLTEPDPSLLLGVPMSVSETGRVQRQRLHDAGLVVRELARLRDVDTAQDARLVAAEAPHGRFARSLSVEPLVGARSPDGPLADGPPGEAPAAGGGSVAGVHAW
ncbi:TIGR04282 family arsenosugar biosynthesis glycosyltransferase [Streptomyces sp. NPDC006632]|uniref:TIGR04282 family arsenosugar biosynthesis glycosyltransferase n=1 Tax=Streptomyces sp. NPDC006632 TaxID=3157182 RepID=UPI0033BA6909